MPIAGLLSDLNSTDLYTKIVRELRPEVLPYVDVPIGVVECLVLRVVARGCPDVHVC